MLKMRQVLLFTCLILASYSSAFAQSEADSEPGDKLHADLNEIFVQAQGHVGEPSVGGFDPVLWKLGGRIDFSSWLEVEAIVGAASLLYLPSYSIGPSQSVSVLDVQATLHSDIGDFYAGQFLVPWGLEGTTSEEDLWLPRSLFYEKGVFPLRDIGAGFKTEYGGYYMNIAGHNGLGGGISNSDNRVFVTGQWGYQGPAHLKVGMSLTEGRLANPVYVQEYRVRGANAFFGFNIFGLGLQAECSVIENKNDSQVADILAWHGDIQHPLSEHVNLIGRYEQLNPNLRVGSNVLGRGYLGGEYHSHDNVSRLFLFAVKNNESLTQTPGDEVFVAWRLSPK